jgi:hypothetical protein
VRYPEAKIKEAILHPDIEIRGRATTYFAKSFSPDVSIMPVVIKAVETYGRDNKTYELIGAARELAQTEETIAWVIDELNDESCGSYDSYAYNLSMVLVEADPSLLLLRESDILESRHFLGPLRSSITERLRMLSWDEATCWQKLEEFCEEGKDKRYVNDVDLGYADLIVEALARYGQDCETKVLERMAVHVDDYSHHPMKWLEPLLVQLAGQAHLESTVPLIVAKLREDADLLNEACAEALTRIGTPGVLQAIAEEFPNAKWHFRLYSSGPLENIHSDLAVETCLKLLTQEHDENIRRELAHALLSQFAQEGIEVARQLLVGRNLDFEGTGLRNYLLETCVITGDRFPEYDEWLVTEAAEKKEHWKRVKELEGDPVGMMKFALEKLTGEKVTDQPRAKPSSPTIQTASPLTLQQKPASTQKIGRNDPCPCGSGKKFKNCCMKKGGF